MAGVATLSSMIDRPSSRWRREVAEQQAALAAGTVLPEQAYAAQLWPLEFTAAVDAAALEAYERDVEHLKSPTDDAVWSAVERVVVALNAADEEALIETGEREELCQYIDDVLAGAGVDLSALTARRGIDRHELTDTWRDW